MTLFLRLFNQVTHNFVNDYDPTLEAKYTYTCEVDGEDAEFDILDTAGQDEYISLLDTVFFLFFVVCV